jgi:hypothetical protein
MIIGAGLINRFVARLASCLTGRGKRAKRPPAYPLRSAEDLFAKSDEVLARKSSTAAEDIHEASSRPFKLKVASLFFALALAYAVQSGSNVSVVSLMVPLEIKNTPEDRVVVKPTRRGAQVTLKGPSFLVGPIASSPPPLRIKLPDEASDRITVLPQSSDISLPPSVEVLSIEPAQFEFVLEPVERQDVKIEVPRIGKLSKDLVLEGIEISPKQVSIKGPRSEIKQVRVIEAEPIDLSAIDSTTELTLGLRVVGASVTPDSRTVLAKVLVGEQPTERSFIDLPLELRAVSGMGGFMLKPNRVAVKVSGSPSLLGGLAAKDIIPYVRVTELPGAKEPSQRKVQVELPSGLKASEIEPEEVTLELDQRVISRAPVVKKR